MHFCYHLFIHYRHLILIKIILFLAKKLYVHKLLEKDAIIICRYAWNEDMAPEAASASACLLNHR